jgi:hypothetical protein
MKQGMSNAWKATLRFVNHNQLRTVLIYSAATISGFALIDFTRKIDIKMCENFDPKSSDHLAESLEQLHFSAFDGKIQYKDILLNRNKSIELHYLSAVAEKHSKVLLNFRQKTSLIFSPWSRGRTPFLQ